MHSITQGLALGIVLALAFPAMAAGCEMTSSQPEFSTPTCGIADDVIPCFYVENDVCQVCLISIWVYQESNGIPGLQRGDEVVDDTCGGLYRSDTVFL